MPNRILRDGILTSEAVDRLGSHEEVFYRRLYSIADDHGRYYANPKLIRAAAYPFKLDRVSDSDIGKWLTSCVETGLVRVYPASDGKRYLQIVKFGQQVRAKSKFPDPLPTPDINCEQLLANAHLGGGVVGGGDGGVLVTPEGVTRPNSSDPPPPSASNCPAQRIVDLYHAKLPELPRCEKLTPTRRGYLQQRWREDLETLDDWSAFFADVRKSDFLMGKRPGRDGRPPFRADLEWLTKPANYAKFIEGKYHRAA